MYNKYIYIFIYNIFLQKFNMSYPIQGIIIFPEDISC